VLLAQILGTVVGASARAPAQTTDDAPPERITLSWAIARALERNPEVQAADARVSAMEERPSQEGALPDPMLMVRYHNEDWGISFGDSDFSYLEVGVEQELPFAGKRGARRQIAEREALRERAMRDMTALMVLARVGMQYAELAAQESTDAALTESLASLDALTAQVSARYSVGEAEQQDVLRTGLERDMIRERLAMVARERAQSRAQLAALLGAERPEELPPTAGFDAVRNFRPLDELRAKARDLSPELQAAREETLRAKEALRLAKREYFPDIGLTAAYMDKKELMPEWEVGLRVSLPLYARSKQRHAVAEAAFAETAAQRDRQRVELDVAARIAELHAAAESSSRLVALYRDSLLPSAALTFQSATASYATGRVDLMTVMSAFIAMLDYRIREAEETANLMTALAEMGPLLGETPLGEPFGAQR
jgi:outer membrane protein TolC